LLIKDSDIFIGDSVKIIVHREVDAMKISSAANSLGASSPYPKNIKLRYIVGDEIKLFIINADNNKVIREVPRKLSSKIIKRNLYV